MTAIAAVALVLTGAVGAFLLAGDQSNSPSQTVHAQDRVPDRGISVQGEGQVSVTPDVARVTLGVEIEGSDLDILREDADTRMNDVIDALQEMGIDDADIRTVTYDIRVRDERVEPMQPRDEPDVSDDPVTDEVDPEPGEQIYMLVQLVQVRITDIDAAGEVINTALEAGANRVGSISFEVEDRQDAIDQARELAVAEARHKAEHLAELTDLLIGVPLTIEESSPSGPPMRMEEFAMEADMPAEDAMARIEPGEQVISVSVYITYDVK